MKARCAQKRVTSDWMELERQRGISITSTVLQFDYRNFRLNLLDTPGHQDFSEDTYRTLAAVDNAVMLEDAGKGLEPQTRKLFEVCQMRRLPIFTFINKMDRPSRDPLELMDEIESELGLKPYPAPLPGPLAQGSASQLCLTDALTSFTSLSESPGDGYESKIQLLNSGIPKWKT
jgi:peptide chain release factor 3